MKISLRDTASFLLASRVPNLLIIGATQVGAAYFLMDKEGADLWQLSFVSFVISTAMIGAGGYIINDYFDQKVDMINRPDEVLVGTRLRRRLALFFHLLLTLGGIGLGFFLDSLIGAIHIFSAGALWTYSGILKKQFLMGILTISFLTSLSLLIVMVYFRQFEMLVVAYAVFGFVTIFIRESIKDIISARGESAFGYQSVPLVWGMRGAKLLIFIVGLGGVGLLIFYLFSVPGWPIKYFFMGISALIVWLFFRLARADKVSTFQQIKNTLDLVMILGLASMTLV